MKHVDIRRAARLIAPVCLALSGLGLALPLRAQTYRNISNQKFRTVANGPQSALIVDVPNPNDTAAVRKAALAQYQASLAAQKPAIQKEIAFLRQRRLIRPTQQFDYVQAAIVRSNGRLAIPPVKQTRAVPGGNDIVFNFPVDGTNPWPVAKATELNNLANNILKPEMKLLLGNPLWNGTVTVLNSDPRLGKGDEVIGALLVINGTDVQILFPSFSDPQTEFLAMAQAMAQAFHGPLRIGYDAWEQGMARAATVVAAKDIGTYTVNGATTTLDPTNGFYYTPYYDLENQPALGNNTFTPPTKSNQSFNPATLSGMLIPRLEMSSMAWLKCYIENRNFFQQFNSGYYDAYVANNATANDVNALRTIAKAVVPSVEAQAFDTWFEQQYVLDTSVTVGPKLYAYTLPTFPVPASGSGSDTPGGASVFFVYYNTTLTSSGVGDETDLNGTVNPIYWDYNFQNRLFPTAGSDAVTISSGFGSVAPFLNNLGGSPADLMKVTMDFPAAREYARVPFPANQTGTSDAPNDFSGVFIGATSGNLVIQFENGTSKTVSVVQAEFGGTGAPSNSFSRDKFAFTTGSTTLNYQRNILHRTGTAAPIFKFVAPAPTVTVNSVIQNGPRMISIPTRPLNPDLAKALGADPATALLAQYRQDLTTAQKYQFYPTLSTYQPGYGLWSNLNLNLGAAVTGESTDADQDISVPLLFGWNQIGTPYSSTPGLNVTTADISFSYRSSGETLSLADAIAAGWVAAGITAYSPSSGYVDILTSADLTVPQNTLEPWKGYWIRVTVTEGVTIIYSNPANRSARATRLSRGISKSPRPLTSWTVPLALRDATGNVSAAVFGQSNQGGETFNSRLDIASPPAFTRAATLGVRFPHADWDTGNGVGGDFLSDIRRTGARAEWNVTVSVPQTQQPYTLTWPGTAKVPRGTRLTLVDKTTGSRTFMNNASSYAFTPGKDEVTRQFQIVAEPRSSSALTITNLGVERPLAGPGRAASNTVIHYELSTEAQTTVNIRLNGSIVRHLTGTGRAAQAGTNQLVWDLRDDHGLGMPGGSYTVEISAQTTEGERTRSILPIIITR